MIKRIAAITGALALIAGISGCTLFTWGGPAAPQVAPEADSVFKDAEKLLSEGKYEQAREKYSSVKEADLEKSYEPLVQIRLGDSYYEETRYSEAEVEYRRFLEMHPHNKAAPYVVYQIGMCNFKQMDLSDRDPAFATAAMDNFRKLLTDYPDNPYQEEAREKFKMAKNNVAGNEFVVGMFYYTKGSYKAAQARFKGIIEGYPGSKDEPEALYYLADTSISLGDYEGAKAALARLYQEHPNNRFADMAQKKLVGKIPSNP